MFCESTTSWSKKIGTNVILSDDLSNAKIFYSCLNSKDEIVAVEKALKNLRAL